MSQIRIATPHDAAAIAALHAKSWRQTYQGVLSDHYLDDQLDEDRLADWRQRLDSPLANQYVVVLEAQLQPGISEKASITGFACAYGAYDASAGTLLENLHAHPQHKQKGTGRLLLQHIARWSLEHYPNDALHLWVVEPNAAAIGFYRHMGAVEDARAVWDAPGGAQVPELRYIWRDPARLLA